MINAIHPPCSPAASLVGGVGPALPGVLRPARPAIGRRISPEMADPASAYASPASDPDLAALTRLSSGDGTGLDELMVRHQESLHRFIYRYTGSDSEAADLVQETFVRVFRKAASYQPRAAVKTWIYSIALNLCRDRARRTARLRWVPFLRSSESPDQGLAPEDTLADPATGPSETAGLLEAASAVSAAIRALPGNLRAPFTLCVLEDHSHADAARIMKLTLKTIEVRIYRARQQLREALRPFLADVDSF